MDDRSVSVIAFVEPAQGEPGDVSPETVTAKALAEAAAAQAQQRATAAATARDQAQNAVGYGRFVADTQAQLAGADALARPDGAIAEVINDPGAVTSTTGNGTYVKVGAPGAGSFAKRNDQTLPALATAVGLRQLASPATRALALLAGVTAGLSTFVTQGYATPGDGGGATYVEESSTYVATALDIVVGGKKFRNASFILTPQMLGAVADGVANDRNAVATISTFGRPVKLVGRYKIDSTFSFAAGSYIFAEPGQGVLVAGASGGIINSNARSNITIKGVWFEGRMDAPDTAGLVQYANGSFVRLEDCRLYDHKSFGPSFVNMRDSGWHKCVIRNTGFHDNVDYVASGSLFLPSNIGLPPEMQNPDGWRLVNRNNYCTHCTFEEAYGCHVAYQTAFTGDYNYLYGRGKNPPGWGITHCSYSSFCHNEVSSGPFGGAAFDILVGYHLKVNDNTCWQCGGAGILFANITDSEACNNLCIDNWASRDVDPVANPGNGPSLHRGGIVLDCDVTKLNPTVARILISNNICKNTQPAATQQNGLQIRNPATMDFASINIEGSNQFSGNAKEDITPPYWYTGLKARSNRAYVAPAYAASGATDYDPRRAGMREIAERVSYLESVLVAQGVIGEVPFPLPGATLDMDFARGQYLGKQPSDLTTVRNNVATDLIPKDVQVESFTSFAANTAVIVPGRGLVAVPNKTQIFDNPAAPATQTVNLATGTFTAWCLGGGFMTATQGTGVAAEIGAGGVVIRPGTPLTFAVTTAGSFTFTTNNLRFMQLEDGPEASTFIPYKGASNGSVVSLAGQAFTDIFGSVTTGTLYADFTPLVPATYATPQQLFNLSDGTTSNRVLAFRDPTTGNIQTRHAAGGVSTNFSVVASTPRGRSSRMVLSYGVGTGAFRAVVNGGVPATGSPTAAPSGLNTLRFLVNEAGSGQQGYAILRRLAFVPATMADHIAQKYTAP